MTAPKAVNDNHASTRDFWSARLGRCLSDDEAIQIEATMTGFFKVLAGWAGNSQPVAANDNVREDSATPHNGPENTSLAAPALVQKRA
ncbi:hypothetical protein GRZ55_06700 [Chelativorans sp. ZYF759]|uniref:hypothetical protein n=1 Tax=Chelativorans sp. ZYF759 TaxID=2692213 RepID=UPI00145D3AE7|nr:hypothetical protein [Chelativorans sp. ZYF759]NMG38929.1 hypothetical protein [Chelativorans sp. ZYF759]